MVLLSCNGPTGPQHRLRTVIIGLALVSCLVVRPAHAGLAGDANCDGAVDDRDVSALIENLFAPSDCTDGDANQDGTINAADLPALMPSERPVGPVITFFGIASAAGDAIEASATSDDGLAIYARPVGVGFKLIIEGSSGSNGQAVGRVINSVSGRPDIQIETERTLGNGSFDRCPGTVPAIDPADFQPGTAIDQALLAFSCTFEVITARTSACSLDPFGNPNWLAPTTQTQFCTQIEALRQFPAGQTRLTAHLRDVSGNLGPAQRIIIQIGTAPSPATRTITPTRTATRTTTRTNLPTSTATTGATTAPTPTASATPIQSPTTTRTLATRLATATPTSTSTPPTSSTRTLTPSPPLSATRTATVTMTRQTPATASPTSAVNSATPTVTTSRTATARFSATVTASATVRGTTPTPSGTRTNSASPTRTRTPTGTLGATATSTLLPTLTRTRTFTPQFTTTPTRTRTPTFTPTPTPVPMAGAGPVITFFGVANANDTIATPIGTAPGNIPIYRGNSGFGFSLVVEARPGISGKSVGQSVFQSDEGDPTLRPDLQIEVNRPLGNGSTAVCDSEPPLIGGIPAVNPPSFSVTQSTSNALNDFGCRFLDGSGHPGARGPNDACTVFSDGTFAFTCGKTTNPGCTSGASTVQYCGQIARPFAFPSGDTLVTVQVLDTASNPGPPAQLFIRN